ncbi:hypothetical protein EES43_29000 [Streptomyces sp. ADI96-02]|uniref:ATP-binding protein n=1 Tax=Streptomyces sp. ADI96-02 TaxID=1522760 RepID=UPI000F551383|nr:ATP-binding protein [Streptomyces sp. ADI96-02]RPK54393.1 hypothetical protein EES43_29000 [Streptomyces sp. ADI96-02]
MKHSRRVQDGRGRVVPVAAGPTRRTSACPWACHWAAAALTGWEATGEEKDDVLLVMCELVTNATGPIRAHLSRDTADRYHVQVDDGGPARHDEHDDQDGDEHGRGLVLVDHLAARHGQRRAPYPYQSRARAVLTPATRAEPRAAIPAARTLEPTS